MDVEPKITDRPKILTLVGGVIIGFGISFVPLGIIGAVVSYLKEDKNFFLSLYSLYDSIGAAIGGVISLSLIVILVTYWEKLLDG